LHTQFQVAAGCTSNADTITCLLVTKQKCHVDLDWQGAIAEKGKADRDCLSVDRGQGGEESACALTRASRHCRLLLATHSFQCQCYHPGSMHELQRAGCWRKLLQQRWLLTPSACNSRHMAVRVLSSWAWAACWFQPEHNQFNQSLKKRRSRRISWSARCRCGVPVQQEGPQQNRVQVSPEVVTALTDQGEAASCVRRRMQLE